MKDRLERALVGLARRHAPQLVPANWSAPGDYPRALPDFARLLAESGVLPLLGDVPVPHTNEASVHLKLWVDTYTHLYQMLTGTLFPSLTAVNAFYADQEWPPLVALVGSAGPVTSALGAYVAPFVAVRQGGLPVTEVELRGLLDLVLEELEAGDLPRDQYQRLRTEASGLVKDLLALQVRQMPLTPPASNLFGVSMPAPALPAEPPKVAAAAQPPMPDTMPDENTPVEPMTPVAGEKTVAMPPTTLPEDDDASNGRRTSGRRRPPIPDLPDDLR